MGKISKFQGSVKNSSVFEIGQNTPSIIMTLLRTKDF
jgi:hypothetical protein